MGQQSVGWSLLRLLCGLAAMWATALAPAVASAQSTSPYLPAPPPLFQRVDKNNVDLNSSVSYRLPLLSIGPSGPGGLSLEAIFNYSGPYGWTNNLVGQANLNGPGAPFPGVGVSVGNHTDAFALQNDGTYVSTMGTGAAVSVASNGLGLGYTVTYTATDGSVYVFNTGIVNGNNNLTSITYKTGEVVSFNYTVLTANQNPFGIPATRLASVTTNTGYGIHFDYDQTNVMAVVKATAWNMTVETCAPTAPACSFLKTWPTASYVNGQQGFTSITDATGVTTSFTYDGTLYAGDYYLTKIQMPSGWVENFHYTTSPTCTSQTSSCASLSSVDYGPSAGTWTYAAASVSYSDGTGTYYLSAFDPYADVSSYSNGVAANHCLFPNVDQDALGRAQPPIRATPTTASGYSRSPVRKGATRPMPMTRTGM